MVLKPEEERARLGTAEIESKTEIDDLIFRPTYDVVPAGADVGAVLEIGEGTRVLRRNAAPTLPRGHRDHDDHRSGHGTHAINSRGSAMRPQPRCAHTALPANLPRSARTARGNLRRRISHRPHPPGLHHPAYSHGRHAERSSVRAQTRR